MKKSEQLQENDSQASLETLELKANLNPEQREHLELLKDKMKRILGGKTKQELAKTGDLEALRKYKNVLEAMLEFLRTKEIVLDDEMRKQRQIKKIESIIINLGDESLMTEEQKWRLALLTSQIDIINEADQDKTSESRDYGEQEFLPVTQFTMDQIIEFISKVENLDKDDIFKIHITTNENDQITWVDFGVVGNTDHVYTYILAHLNIDDNGERYSSSVGDDTVIHKSDVELKSGDIREHYHYSVIARWSEERKVWLDDDGNEIKV